MKLNVVREERQFLSRNTWLIHNSLIAWRYLLTLQIKRGQLSEYKQTRTLPTQACKHTRKHMQAQTWTQLQEHRQKTDTFTNTTNRHKQAQIRQLEKNRRTRNKKAVTQRRRSRKSNRTHHFQHTTPMETQRDTHTHKQFTSKKKKTDTNKHM